MAQDKLLWLAIVELIEKIDQPINERSTMFYEAINPFTCKL